MMFILCSSLYSAIPPLPYFIRSSLNAFLGECIPSYILSVSPIWFRLRFSSNLFFPKSSGLSFYTDFTFESIVCCYYTLKEGI